MRDGEKNGRAKMTAQEVAEAKEHYRLFGKCRDYELPGNHMITSVKKLAEEHGVSPSTMYSALKKETWKHVP